MEIHLEETARAQHVGEHLANGESVQGSLTAASPRGTNTTASGPGCAMYDAHIHLDVMSPEALGEGMWRSPTYRAFVPGCDPNDAETSLARFAADPRLAHGTAIHPWETVPASGPAAAAAAGDSHRDPRWPLLEAQASVRICAIGECGLDDFKFQTDEERAIVERYFVAQVALALAVRKPLVIHCVRAHARCAELLTLMGANRVGGLVHAFGGADEEAKRYARLGFVVSIGAAVTRERSTRVRALAAALPEEGFVVETDAPYMTTGGRPAWSGVVDDLEAVVATIAALRQEEPELVARAERVTRRLFGQL